MKNLLSICLFVVCATVQAQKYHVTNLGSLGGDSAAAAINASGQVVGYSTTTTGRIHAFLYTGGTMHDLGTFGGPNSYALGIDANGDVVGYADTYNLDLQGNFLAHAFLYTGGVMQDLGTLNGQYSQAHAINDAGQIVGSSFDAFLYSNNVMHNLGTLGGSSGSAANAVNASTQIVGSSGTSGGSDHAFLYSGGTMHDLGTLGGLQSNARGINASGQIVGASQMGDFVSTHAFLYANGVMHDLGTLGGTFGTALAINAGGQTVGNAQNSGGTQLAFLYANGAMKDLDSLLDSSGAGLTVTDAAGINDHGAIAATAYGNGQQSAVVLSSVEVAVDPTAYAIVKGQYVSGSLSSLFSIDGDYLVGRTNAARQRSSVGFTMTIDGTSPLSTPSDLRLLLTGHVNSTNLGQKVEMFDYVANAWVVVDSAGSTLTDSTETAVASSPARFVQAGTNAMKARISWNPTGIASVFPWSVSIDQAVWNVSP